MKLLQSIVKLFQRLYSTIGKPTQKFTIQCIYALFNFLRRFYKKQSRQKENTTGYVTTFDPVPSVTTSLEGTVSATHRMPVQNSLHPHPSSGPNTSALSQDVSTSSIHTDETASQSSQPLFAQLPGSSSLNESEQPFEVVSRSWATPDTEINSPIPLPYKKFHPISPDSLSLFNIFKKPTEVISYTIAPQTRSFEPKRFDGWECKVHPEGGWYYIYKGKYYTNRVVMNTFTQDCIMTCIDDFDRITRSCNIQISSKVNAVFNLHQDPSNPRSYLCDYYIADHDTCIIFWLQRVEAGKVIQYWKSVGGSIYPAHIKHAIVSLYWVHCILYPSSCSGYFTPKALNEGREFLCQKIDETIQGVDKIKLGYKMDQLKEMIFLINNIPSGAHAFIRKSTLGLENPGAAGIVIYSMCVQPKLESIMIWRTYVGLLGRMMYSFDIYHQLLLDIGGSGFLLESSWLEFIQSLKDELQQIILFNTVLLNADIAFLAIQSIDNSSNLPKRSPAQIACFLSIVACFGSIILGLILVRTHYAKTTGDKAVKFLEPWTSGQFGFGLLAFLYSVPYALLLWGVIGFLVAFSFMCYTNSNVFVRSLMSVAWLVIITLCLWSVALLADWGQYPGVKLFWSYASRMWHLLLSGLRQPMSQGGAGNQPPVESHNLDTQV
ncbi:hypothetical protein F5880DRAFT_1730331 [Lentinula raphanica]|nr:hypothetical protein F5880DRAFT_1730331 [Lentinula raphanica]